MTAIYRGRIAPSPTGLLHLGHARTFWIACQRAVSAQGTLVLRIDDLDPQRSRQHFTEAMIEDLRWLGIAWTEGPFADGNEGGERGPYRQSERHAFYLGAWEQLRQAGLIYPCRCSRKDLAWSAAAPHEDESGWGHEAGNDTDDEPIYPGTCRPAPGTVSSAASPAGMNWRFLVPSGEILSFEDGNMGTQQFTAGRDFGDFLIWRRDNVPAYQLACAVDDAAMHITEVVRGADLLKSTARQMLLNRILGYQDPAWFHCDLVRDARGQRLAKRHDAQSLRALRAAGRTPQELIGAF